MRRLFPSRSARPPQRRRLILPLALAAALAATLAAAGWLAPAAAHAAAALAAPAKWQVAAPRFESGPCPFPAGAIAAGERVDCGNLIVPEDRSQPGAASISLAVAIIRTHNPAPAGDPILFLADGPGESGLGWLGYFLTGASALRADRDIILLDQRGTGYSQPSLSCPEFDRLERAAQARQLSVTDARALDVQTAAACHDRLTAAGIQLAAYTTETSAADIKDLRVALGYFSWNLYGVGYGTRLALAVLRDFPDGVRSVVLDSAMPPQAAWWETSAADANRGFAAFFRSCAQQAACAAAYPNLAITFADAVSRLTANPLSVYVTDPASGSVLPVLVTGRTLIAGTAQVLSDDRPGLTPFLPLVITQLDAGNAAAAQAFAQALQTGADNRHSGAWYGVQCHDEGPFNDPAKIRADATAFALFRDFVLSDSTLAVCPGWAVGRASPQERQAVHSDVPALVLAGDFDPLSPPLWGQLAASTLANSYYFLLAGAGHGASLRGCGQALTAQFVENPNLAPRPTCVTGSTTPAFVSGAYLNPGIPRVAQALVLHFDLAQAAPFLVCAGLFVTALAAWPLAALFQRPPSRRAGFARWLAIVTALLDLLFAAAVVVLILLTNQQQPGLLIFGLPPETAPLFLVPWLAAALTLGLAILALLAWKDGDWSLAGRVHFTLVAGAAVAFIWLLYSWGLVRLG